LLCYVGMVVVTALFLNFVVPHILHHKLAAPWSELMGEIGGMFVAFVPALLMARMEKRPFGAYGLPAQEAFRRNFWVGALWGFAAISILLLAIEGVGDFSIGGLALHGARILKFGVLWAIVFLCVGFFEEFLMRGYSQFTLTQGVGFWPAAILLSLAFGALHLGNAGENRTGIVAVVMIALFFCLTLRRTGNLWFAVGFHAAFDWGESYFYSVPDSGSLSPGHLLKSSFHGSRWITGGSDGPEGSLLVLALIVLLGLAFDRMYPEVQYQA
jgi:membrane protease YdiL (CAAX protease family)